MDFSWIMWSNLYSLYKYCKKISFEDILFLNKKSKGGMKAVIWTDVIQASIMFLGLILSIIFGIYLKQKKNF